MRERTEDLLSLRDGEPVDASLCDRVARDREAAAELDRLAEMRERLRQLPGSRVPTGHWNRIESALAARDRAPAARGRRLVAGLAAAAVLAAVALAGWLAWNGGGETPASVVMRGAEEPAAPTQTAAANGRDYRALVEESARLEHVLRQLPPQRRLIDVGTASTIVGLEQQIALIDMQLTLGAAAGADAEIHEALWQDRVELMNALVHVRYARSQPFSY